MRRRIVLAVIFLAAFVLLLRIALLAGEFDTVITAANFETARDDHAALRAFLYRMPKGGDLHTHLSGAAYAERFIAWAAREDLVYAMGLTADGKLLLGIGNQGAVMKLDDDRVFSRLAKTESEQVTGKLTPAVAQRLGLSTDCMVVGGAGDCAANAVGTGVVTRGTLSASVGTSGVMFVHSDEMQVDGRRGVRSVTPAAGCQQRAA